MTTPSLPLCWFFARYHWLYDGPALINPRRNQRPAKDRNLPEGPKRYRCRSGVEETHSDPEPGIFHRPLASKAHHIIAVGHEEAVPQRHADRVGQVNGQGMPAHELYKSGQSRNMANKDSTNDARWGFKRLLRKADQQV